MAESDLDADLFNLAMSEEAQPLMDAVKKHIADNVVPITEEFYALDAEKEERWSWHPRQLELLEGAKDKAKASGLWNFFLPDSEIGEGLTNLDYAYIAAELGKYALASETLNCSAPSHRRWTRCCRSIELKTAVFRARKATCPSDYIIRREHLHFRRWYISTAVDG